MSSVFSYFFYAQYYHKRLCFGSIPSCFGLDETIRDNTKTAHSRRIPLRVAKGECGTPSITLTGTEMPTSFSCVLISDGGNIYAEG